MPTRLRHALLVCALVGLALISIRLALGRMYQVDELENAYNARILALGKHTQYTTNAALHLHALRPIAASALRSTQLMDAYRLVFLPLCWLTIGLLFRATGLHARSALGACVLLLAATLPSFWIYGYELRHDNVLVLGIAAWLALAVPRATPLRPAYALLGALAVVMQACAFKAFLYWLPLMAASLALPHPAHRALHGRLRLCAQMLVGVLAAAALTLLVHVWLGTLGVFLASFGGGARVAQRVAWRDHTPALLELASQAPLLVLALVASCMRVALGFSRHGMRYASWSGALPATLLAWGGFGVFLLNPTPFRYNFLPLCALLFLAAAQLLAELHARLRSPLERAALLVCALLVQLGSLAPRLELASHTGNARQRTLMSLAERMTDPQRDRVYAAAGLVLTRESIEPYWFLHSLNLRAFADGTYPTVRSMLRANPPAVLIRSYRTDWLGLEEHKLIGQRYLPLTDDFWLLGDILPTGSGSFECVHAGRYELRGGQGPIELDAQRISERIHYLRKGTHQITSQTRMPLFVRWVGPRLTQPPKLVQQSRHGLFAYPF
jgi:hypothetical protein